MTSPPRTRIALVHGFTQTGASWRQVSSLLHERLGEGVEIVAPDAPGHGTNATLHLDLTAGARHLGDSLGRAVYVGYSMGGRLSLHLALERPDLVERMVLIGATPGIEDIDERAARRRADDELAAELELIGVDAFLERWLAQPLFATLPPDERDLAERRRNTVDGLAASLRRAGTGTQEPLWARIGEITVPVLVVVGEHDAKFAEIGRRMVSLIEHASFATIPGAGHAAHLEQPVHTVETVTRWLGDTQPESANPRANPAP